jgi:hypothetical protein
VKSGILQKSFTVGAKYSVFGRKFGYFAESPWRITCSEFFTCARVESALYLVQHLLQTMEKNHEIGCGREASVAYPSVRIVPADAGIGGHGEQLHRCSRMHKLSFNPK